MTKSVSFTRMAFVFALVGLVTLLPELASAQMPGLQNGLCTVMNTLNGTIGRSIATIAIIFLGIGAFFGKVNWGLALVVTVAVIVVFGASAIAGQLQTVGSGGTAVACA